MTCALVPLTPKDETPAVRGPASRVHGRASPSSATVPADQSTSGVGVSACNVRGRTPCRIAWTVLMTLSTPAAACG